MSYEKSVQSRNKFGNLIIHDLRNCKNHGRESIEIIESTTWFYCEFLDNEIALSRICTRNF